MSTAKRLFCIALLLASAASISPAQEAVEAEPVEKPATEASLLAAEVSDGAYSPSGDTQAEQAFQTKVDEAAVLMQQIASESSLGKDVGETGPLFQRTAALTLEAVRLVREGAITIDPAVAEEFVAQFRELEKQYSSNASAVDTSLTETSLP